MTTYHEAGYNADDMENIFTAAARIVRTTNLERPLQWCPVRQRMFLGMPTPTREARAWHMREQERYQLHPAVRKAMRMSRPTDWQQLLLEWPHQSTTDRNRVAYTQTERKGEGDIQTVTSLGKYLRAHFMSMPDHAIRDIVALHSTSGCKFVHTIAEMIYHIQRGPYSCMQKSGHGLDEHPYRAYDPRLGWHLAVLEEGGETVSRALCNTDDEGQKYFVRTYAKHEGGTRTCERMQAWLKEQGYEHRSGWDIGTRMAHIETSNNCGFVAPYIDGYNQYVNVTYDNGVQVLTIDDSDGAYECCRQDGDADDQQGQLCGCGDRFNEDDGLWVGYHEDEMVCECCAESYVYGRGRGGRAYHFSSDNAVYCDSDDTYYHENYLGDNSMVWDVDGNVVPECDTCEIDGDNYLTDDKRVVCLESGEYGLKEDCWQCCESGEWYSDDVDYVEIDGNTYHPDNAPEQDEDTDETSDNV